MGQKISNRKAYKVAVKDIAKENRESNSLTVVHLLRYKPSKLREVITKTVMVPSGNFGDYSISAPIKLKKTSGYRHRGNKYSFRCAATQI